MSDEKDLEVRVTDYTTGKTTVIGTIPATGKKFDGGKAPLDLIPYEALEGIAKVLDFGCKKYDRANWANGIQFSRLISAAQRHLGAYNSGQDIDPESLINHVHHAACNLAFLAWMLQHRPDMDDRWFKLVKK